MDPDETDKTMVSDAELLGMALCGGAQSAATVALASRLLTRFGGLRNLLHRDEASVLTEPGMGQSRVRLLHALPELARRYFEDALSVGEAIKSPADTERFLQARMRHLGHELFCCLFLDNRHRVLSFNEMFRGTIDGQTLM